MVEAERFIDIIVLKLVKKIRSAASLVPDLFDLQPKILELNRLVIYIETQLHVSDDAYKWISKVISVIIDLYKAIDDYVLQSGQGRFRGRHGSKYMVASTRMINDLAEQVKSLANSVELLRIKKAERIKHPWSNGDVFVGRREEVAKLKSVLVENSDAWVVGVVGMGGVGKTSLAEKVYSGLRKEFDLYAWANVSNKRDFRSLLQELILQLTMESNDKVMGLSENDLWLLLYKVQLENKCLIVLDDVRSVGDFLGFSIACPPKEFGTRTKVLITTRIREVGHMVAYYDSGIVHVLNGLSDNESWDLISRIAPPLLPEIKDDVTREVIGKEIAKKCDGLPLAINLLRKYLSRNGTLDEWIALSQNITFDKSIGDGIHQLVGLSFMDLPLNLKHCLLFLARFSENLEIDSNMLCKLWISEGLVQSGHGNSTETVMEIADSYLQELASRGMVEVQEDEISGVRRFRSCRMNSMIRDICLQTAKEQNFVTVMDLRCSKQSMLGSLNLFSRDKVRKIAAHLDGIKDGFRILFRQKETEMIRAPLLTKTCRSSYELLEVESPLMVMFNKVLKTLHLDDLNFRARKLPKETKN